MRIAAIDPGTTQSALVVIDSTTYEIIEAVLVNNSELLALVAKLHINYADVLVIEMFKSYGMTVGDSVLESCVWIGRFIQVFDGPYEFLPRKTVVTEICGLATAKDKHVRAALLDFYRGLMPGGLSGLGAKPDRGLYAKFTGLSKIKADLWSALAIAICWAQRSKRDFKNSLTLT